MAPVVVKNRVIAGVSGDDLDVPGYIQAHDAESGEMQWRWYVVPQKMGDPGSSDLVALNAASGEALWQARLNSARQQRPHHGRQYVVIGAGDTLWTFVMNEAPQRGDKVNSNSHDGSWS